MFRKTSNPVPRTISLAPSGNPLAKTLALLLLGGVLATSWRSFAATHQRRLSARHAAKPEPLQTWEGEGGQSAYTHVDPEATARQAETA